jgi:hypothetical protein
MNKISMVVGFDQREAIAYHVFCQSVLEKCSLPVQFLPLSINSLANYRETHTDGSNKFIYSRFLTPFLMDWKGWAIFADGDMVCRSDIHDLWSLRDESKAVLVVKHDYMTKANTKYLGNKNENYPRKNWSSLVLWNCSHSANRLLTPDFIQSQPGSYLHRFSWLSDELIGNLPAEWNWLATEYEDNYDANLVHYTLGTPCFKEYSDSAMADEWMACYERSQDGAHKKLLL